MDVKRWTYPLLLAGGLVLLAVGLVLANPSATYGLNWWTVDSGGGALSGGGYALEGTAGQPEAGALGGGSYALSGGFWTAVKYETHLPLAFQNYSYCVARPGGHESEPNENRDQANAICMGIPVTGNPNNSYPNAELDWYKLEWNAQGTLQVDLTNFVADAQLILYKDTTELTKDFTPDVNNNFQVTYNGAAGPGTYYILATAGTSRPGGTVPDYTLTASVH